MSSAAHDPQPPSPAPASPPDTPPAHPLDPTIAAACAKAGLVWVAAADRQPQAVWFVWHEDALHLVVGGGEQPDPVPPVVTTVEVRVPSKDTRARLVTFPATVERLHPDDPRWEAAVFRLKAGRLNAADTATLTERWATTSTVLRLQPVATPPPAHDTRPTDETSGAAPLQRSPAATVSWHPFHRNGRTRRRRSR